MLLCSSSSPILLVCLRFTRRHERQISTYDVVYDVKIVSLGIDLKSPSDNFLTVM